MLLGLPSPSLQSKPALLVQSVYDLLNNLILFSSPSQTLHLLSLLWVLLLQRHISHSLALNNMLPDCFIQLSQSLRVVLTLLQLVEQHVNSLINGVSL
jgi:hypothetical protein